MDVFVHCAVIRGCAFAFQFKLNYKLSFLIAGRVQWAEENVPKLWVFELEKTISWGAASHYCHSESVLRVTRAESIRKVK